MTISGPEILVRTLSKPTITDRHGNVWNYHGRSDRHSKVACWGIVFDLLRNSKLLREHVGAGRVAFGINVEMRDFQHDRKKKLDLVICQPASPPLTSPRTLASLADHYQIDLAKKECAELQTIDKVKQLPRRSKTGISGFDALAIVVVDCTNDGSALKLHTKPPAPPAQDLYHYAAMIDRLNGIYAARFAHV